MTPRKLWTLRRFLIGIHEDLRAITALRSYDDAPELTDLEKLVIVLEDRRFFRHRGVDVRSVMREVFRAITFRRHGGASTIDMQFVRTVTGYKELTLRRKTYEMALAYLLQFRMDKRSILRSYLDVVYLGSGLTGMRSTSLKLFERSPSDLSRAEAARIVAMMVYPRPMSPAQLWEAKIARRAMYGLALIDRGIVGRE